MKKFAALLIFAASLVFAVEPTRPAAHPAVASARSACQSVLQPQMQADTTVAFQLRDRAYQAGLGKGLALGAGAMLLLVAVVAEIKKTKQKDPKPLTRAASA